MLLEKRKKIAVFASVVLIFFIFFLSARKGPVEIKKIFELKSADLSYYEFVEEETDCKDNCFTEYVVISNGVAFAKKEIKLGGERKTEVKLGLMSKDKAGGLIYRAREFMGGSISAGSDCADCRLYHIFYGSKNETRAFTSEAGNAPQFIFLVKEMTVSAFAGVEPLDSFFIHFVFEPQNGNVIDYHFYPEGTVLKEEFGKKNGELTASETYALDAGGLEILKKLAADDYFRSDDSDLENCDRNGLKWGYLEILKGASYKTVYTCGLGASGADKLFNELFNSLNGN